MLTQCLLDFISLLTLYIPLEYFLPRLCQTKLDCFLIINSFGQIKFSTSGKCLYNLKLVISRYNVAFFCFQTHQLSFCAKLNSCLWKQFIGRLSYNICDYRNLFQLLFSFIVILRGLKEIFIQTRTVYKRKKWNLFPCCFWIVAGIVELTLVPDLFMIFICLHNSFNSLKVFFISLKEIFRMN